MSGWKMKAVDFYDLLITKQGYLCYLSGKTLTPASVRIVKISPKAKFIKSNVCLVHEILAPLARKYSITEIREICQQISGFLPDKISLTPKGPHIHSKSGWHTALDRISNFNRGKQRTQAPSKIRHWTWAERASEQLRSINKP